MTNNNITETHHTGKQEKVCDGFCCYEKIQPGDKCFKITGKPGRFCKKECAEEVAQTFPK